MNQPMIPQQPGQGRNLGQIIANLGQQSSLVARSTVDPRALAAGIKPSFASITFKGKVWGIRHRGVTQQLLSRDPSTGQVVAIPYIDVIIIKSATAISKTYYIDKYKEGDYRQPDCWSTNGQVPDPAAPRKQSVTCRGCQWDAFGSRTMDDGRKGKACADNKRIAVVPAADIKNEAYGGPMLLKLPPSSFAGLSELETQLHMQGYTYFALVMRLTFDHQAAFPKVVFTPISVLNDYQMQEVLNLQQSEVVDRILNEEVFEVSADPAQPTPDQLAQPTPPVSTGIPTGTPMPATPPLTVQQHPSGFSGSQPIEATALGGVPPATVQPTAFAAAAPPIQPVEGLRTIMGGEPELNPPVQPVMTSAFTAPAAQPNGAGGVSATAVHQVLPVAQGAQVPPSGAPVTQSAQLSAPAPQPVQPAPTAPQPQPSAPPPTAANGTGGQPAETPEQTIARLQAELAAASAAASAAAAKPARATRKRTQPVTPTGQPQVIVQPPPTALPGDQPLPFTAHAQPTPETDDVGDAPPDLDSRIDNLLGGGDKT